MTPGAWIVCLLPAVLAGFQHSCSASASSAHSDLLGMGEESQTSTGAGPAFPNPVGLREGPQGTVVVWDGECSCFWHHQVFQY